MFIKVQSILAIFWALHAIAVVIRRDATEYTIPDLLDAQLEDLESGMKEGHFTSLDLTRAYIRRIYEVNDALCAVTEVNPEAEEIAQALDRERAAGYVRSPLHGIPVLVKDNIATADLLNTTAGSYALLGAKVPLDSPVVSKLRAAGAVILGKSNMSQWANFRSFHTTSGWSAYGGQTVGAYHPNQDPSGSSSGSAVASSIGLAFASLGTETTGSILFPSSSNNVVGIKPTVGLTSRTLLIPVSERQDTIGPIARTVRDAAYMLQAIAGKDPADNYTLAQPFDSVPDYVAASRNYSALKGARLGVPRNMIDSGTLPDATVLTAFEAALRTLKGAGALIVDDLNINQDLLGRFRKDGNANRVLGADFLTNLPGYFSALTENPNLLDNLNGVRGFTQTFKAEDYPGRDTQVWDQCLGLGFDNTSPEFWDAYQANIRVGGPEGIMGLLSNYSLNALVLPTDFASDVPAVVGSPVISVPLGSYPQTARVLMNERGDLVDTGPGIPFGISFLGDKWSEESLIGFAAAFEHITNARSKIAPYKVPRTGLLDNTRPDDYGASTPVVVQQ